MVFARIKIIPGIICILLTAVIAFAQDEQSPLEKAKKYLDDAVYYYEVDDYVKSNAELTKLNDLELTSTDLLELTEEPDFTRLNSMKDTSELADNVKTILTKTIDRVDELRRDPSHIRRMVNLLEGNTLERERGTIEMRRSGLDAVPTVVQDLVREREASGRVKYQMALMAIGKTAVPALVEALKVESILARFSVIYTLGELNDMRAVPALKAIADDKTVTSEIRIAVEESLQKILKKPLAEMKSPEEYYERLAESYYEADEIAAPPLHGDSQPVWWWNTEKNALKEVIVPTELYGDKMAQKLCMEGLKVNPDYQLLYKMLCKAYFSAGSKARAEKEEQLIREIMMLGGLCGQEAVLEALNELYVEKGKAESLVFAFYAVSLFTELTKPDEKEIGTRYKMILYGFDYPDPRVRLAAAETLVYIQPKKDFMYSERVVPVLAYEFNKSQSGYQVIIVAPDQDYINKLKGFCTGEGHEVFEARTMEEGISAAGRIPAPDIIIFPEEYESLFEDLRSRFNTRYTPVIMLVDEKNLLRTRDAYVGKAFIELKDVSGERLTQVINKAVSEANPADPLALKDPATRAADALAMIDPEISPFNVRPMFEELRQALIQNRPKHMKLRALSILRHISTPEIIPTLCRIIEGEGVDAELKIEACNVLGNIIGRTGETPSEDVTGAIISALRSDNFDMRLAAARAFGEGNFKLSTRKEILNLMDEESSRGKGKIRGAM